MILIDSAPTHFWKPLLHAVAAGTIDPASHTIDYARQAVDNHFDFVRGEVVQVDRVRCTLTVRGRFDSVETVIGYDRLRGRAGRRRSTRRGRHPHALG